MEQVTATGGAVGCGEAGGGGFFLLVPSSTELIYCPALNEDSPPRSPASDSSLVLLPRGDINTRGNRPLLFTCCRCDFIRHFTAKSVRRYCSCKNTPGFAIATLHSAVMALHQNLNGTKTACCCYACTLMLVRLL